MCSFVPGFLCPTWRLRESSVPLWEWWLVHVHCVHKGWGKSRSTVVSTQNRVLYSCVSFYANNFEPTFAPPLHKGTFELFPGFGYYAHSGACLSCPCAHTVECTFSSGIAVPQSTHMFNFGSNTWAVFHNNCSNSHSHRRCCTSL